MSDELKYTVSPHVEAKVWRDLRTLRKVLNVPDPGDVEAVARGLCYADPDRGIMWGCNCNGTCQTESWRLRELEARAAIAALVERGWKRNDPTE